MNTTKGTVNGYTAVIDTERQTYIPIIGKRHIAEYDAGGPWPYSDDPFDPLQWHRISLWDVVTIEGQEVDAAQGNFERVLWEAVT